MSGRTAAWLPWCTVLITGAPAAAQSIAIDLPAGTLSASVERLARQASVNVVLTDSRLWSRPVPAVRGRMSPDAVVRLLAQAVGARAKRTGRTVWRLVPLPQQVPPRRSTATRATVDAEPNPASPDIIVLASKRLVPAAAFPGSVEVIAAPPIGSEAGTAALVTRSTIISSTYRGKGREKLFIRGIADSSFSGRLQSLTGLYFGDVRLTYSSSDPDIQLYDMKSIEVLQGPQGTLYGSGSLAGIIRLNPNLPERGVVGGMAGVGASAVTRGAIGADADAVMNVPVTSDLAVRVVGYARGEAGFIDRIGTGGTPNRDVNRTRIEGGRVTARWWPGGDWTVDAVAMAQAIRARDNQYGTLGAPPLTNGDARAEPFGSDYAAAHLVGGGPIGDLALVSSTGIASQLFRERFSAFGDGAADVRRRHGLFTHETRLSRRGREGAGWVVGIGYTSSDGRSTVRLSTMSGDSTQAVDHSVSELALFGEGMVRLTPFLSVDAGARWVRARSRVELTARVFGTPVGTSVREERWLLPTASLLVRPVRAVTAYVRYQVGRRPNPLVPPAPELERVGGDERIASIDAGLRWHPDGGAELAASVMRSYWRALRLDILEGSFVLIGVPMGDWRIDSAHLAMRWPITPAFRIDAAATLNRNRSTDPNFQAASLQLPDVAGVIARAGIDWSRSIGRRTTLRIDGWARYEGISRASVGYLVVGMKQGGYVRTGVTVDVDRGADRVTVSMDNLLDSRATRYRNATFNGVSRPVTPLQPRTIRLGYRRTF